MDARVCGWCHERGVLKIMGYAPSADGGSGVTTGMCDECLDREYDAMAKQVVHVPEYDPVAWIEGARHEPRVDPCEVRGSVIGYKAYEE